jgi:hypothetical protein
LTGAGATILGPLPTDGALAAHAAHAAGAAARRWPEAAAAAAAVRDEAPPPSAGPDDDAPPPFPPTSPLPRAWAPSTGTVAAVAADPALPPAAGGGGSRPLALRLVAAPYLPVEDGEDEGEGNGSDPPRPPPRPSPPIPWPPPPAVSNPGFWGIHVREAGAAFALVSWVRVEGGDADGEEEGRSKNPLHSPPPPPRTVEFALRPLLGGRRGGSADPATWLPDWTAPPLAVVLVPVPPSMNASSPSYTPVNATLAAHGPGAAAIPRGGAAAALTVRLLPLPPGPPAPAPPSPSPSPPRPRHHPILWLGPTSLFPSANGPLGSVSPFNAALLDPLRALAPAFLRVPGGCYVEGEAQSHAFTWRTALGPPLARPGHWNGVWGYWSTDGLGLFEFLTLAEAIGAAPLWVVSTGVAHGDGLAPGGIAALVADTLAALEFARGDAGSTVGGSARAAAGRVAPFPLLALGLGNEGCGKPGYAAAAAALATAVRGAYPDVALLVNCDPASGDGVEEVGMEMGMDMDGGGGGGDKSSSNGEVGPQHRAWWAGPPPDGWDWHWYSSADALFAAGRSGLAPGVGGAPAMPPLSPGGDGDPAAAVPRSAPAWATEFAAFDWGIPTSPAGSAKGAAAEAALLTGFEAAAGGGRLAGAAYAPLIAAARAPGLCPTALLVWDAATGSVLTTPSYHVQAMFNGGGAGGPPAGLAPRVGVWDVRPLNASSQGPPRGVAASAACPDPACAAGALSVRLVNYSPGDRTVSVSLRAAGGSRPGAQPALAAGSALAATVLSPPRGGGGGDASTADGGAFTSNTFAAPTAIVPLPAIVPVVPGASVFELSLPAWGVAVVDVVLDGGGQGGGAAVV